jgi:hypothetical protein
MRAAPLWWLLVLGLAACEQHTVNLLSDPVPGVRDAGAHDSGLRDAALPQPNDASTDAGAPTLCGKSVCKCDDGKDSDKDGLVDGLDPECTGPFDDDEKTFGTGIPIPKGPCRDCFWDDNGGSGDDDCKYPAMCLEGAAAMALPMCGTCDVPTECVEACAARTPNGCDCFGCCAITRTDGSVVHVELQDDCAMDKLDDGKACPRCVQNTQCMNPCGRCELCVGRTIADLPADCAGGATDPDLVYVCEEGQSVCSTTAACAESTYCHLGCCLPTVF